MASTDAPGVLVSLQTRAAYRREADTHSILGFLRHTPAFSDMSPQAQLEVARVASFRSCEEGSVPFEDDRDRIIAVVVSGSVMVFRNPSAEGGVGAHSAQKEEFSDPLEAHAARQREMAEAARIDAARMRRDMGDWGEVVNTLHCHGVINMHFLAGIIGGTGKADDTQLHSPSALLLAQQRVKFIVWDKQVFKATIEREARTRHFAFAFDQGRAIMAKSPAKRSRGECSYIADFLSQHRVFQLINRRTLLALASSTLQTTRVPPGTLITKQGTDSDTLFIVLAGTAETFRVDQPGCLEELPGLSTLRTARTIGSADKKLPPNRVSLCQLVPGDLFGEESVSRSNIATQGRMEGIARALRARYRSAASWSTRDAAYSEVMQRDALFSRQHVASVAAVTEMEVISISTRQLTKGRYMSAGRMPDGTPIELSGVLRSTPDNAPKSLRALLAIEPAQRTPNDIANMLHHIPDSPLQHILGRLSPLTRAMIMERAQGSDPVGWFVIMQGNAALFHASKKDRGVDIGAVWVDDYSSGSESSDSDSSANSSASTANAKSKSFIARSTEHKRVPGAVTKAVAGASDRWGRQCMTLTAGDSFGALASLNASQHRFTSVAGLGARKSSLAATVEYDWSVRNAAARGTQVNSHNDVINNRNRQLGIQTMVALTLTAADVREILGPVAMRVCLTPVLATSLMCKPPRYRTREEVDIIVSYLASFRFFYSMQHSYMVAIARLTQRKVVNKGTPLCEEGDVGQTFFVLLSGVATVHSVHSDVVPGTKVSTHRYGSIIGTVSPGDAVGAPVDAQVSNPDAWHHVRTSTVVALTDTLEIAAISLLDFFQFTRFGVCNIATSAEFADLEARQRAAEQEGSPRIRKGHSRLRLRDVSTDFMAKMPSSCVTALHHRPRHRSMEDCAAIAVFLRHLPVYSALPADALLELSKLATLIRAGKGEVVVTEGDEANSVYVVLKGGATVHVKAASTGISVQATSPTSRHATGPVSPASAFRPPSPATTTSATAAATTTTTTTTTVVASAAAAASQRGSLGDASPRSTTTTNTTAAVGTPADGGDTPRSAARPRAKARGRLTRQSLGSRLHMGTMMRVGGAGQGSSSPSSIAESPKQAALRRQGTTHSSHDAAPSSLGLGSPQPSPHSSTTPATPRRTANARELAPTESRRAMALRGAHVHHMRLSSGSLVALHKESDSLQGMMGRRVSTAELVFTKPQGRSLGAMMGADRFLKTAAQVQSAMKDETRWYAGNMKFCGQFGDVVSVLRSGDTFGESALEDVGPTGRTRKASVLSMSTRTILLHFPGSALRDALEAAAVTNNVFRLANVMGTKNLVKNVHSILKRCSGKAGELHSGRAHSHASTAAAETRLRWKRAVSFRHTPDGRTPAAHQAVFAGIKAVHDAVISDGVEGAALRHKATAHALALLPSFSEHARLLLPLVKAGVTFQTFLPGSKGRQRVPFVSPISVGIM